MFRKKETAVNLAEFGAVGPKGDDGSPGASAANAVFGNSDSTLPTGADSAVLFARSGYTHDPSADLSESAYRQITPAAAFVLRDLMAGFQVKVVSVRSGST